MDAVIELTSIMARVFDERTASGQKTTPWQALADAVGAVVYTTRPSVVASLRLKGSVGDQHVYIVCSSKSWT